MNLYCPSIFATKRFKTREVFVGKVGVGANNPVRIQSMTTSNTQDAIATAEQIMKLADYGCEIARVTVQGMKEAYSCEKIKSILVQKGYDIPLVADIHFFPKAAMTVADFVDKVRINPGNYVDKRASFKVLEYSDDSYQKELERLEEKFSPLVLKCKKRGISMRIGTNHGSLSDRVMNRFGDSPAGMVEAALEYTRVCRKLDYHDIIYSMKASNTHVMIQAYRLLVAKMMELNWDYPLHLGVTEAGDGEDGRIKSAVGIGSLLLDGIGDTIRVSLTEDPWHEIDPCKKLVEFAKSYHIQKARLPFVEKNRTHLEYKKRLVNIQNKPLHKDGSVYIKVTQDNLLSETLFEDLGFEVENSEINKTISTVDGLVITGKIDDQKALEALEFLQQMGIGIFYLNQERKGTHRVLSINENTSYKDLNYENCDLIFLELNHDKVHFAREVIEYLSSLKNTTPIISVAKYSNLFEDTCIEMGSEIGSLFCDGLIDGVLLDTTYSIRENRKLSLNLLQACRLRSSKTEYISCPSCGRTLFDLQSVTQSIKDKTAHLPGVKIAVMGCIVNGPGEMADADFGYVGSKTDMIDLYVGKECVEKNIPHEHAVEKLVELLKKHGAWVEPKELAVNP